MPPSRKRSNATDLSDAVLLGMGGSSLGPEVLATTFGQKTGWPRLRILDSTVPAQIEALDADTRSRQDLVYRFQQVGQHDRAQRSRRLFFQARGGRGRRRQGRAAFHCHHGSRIVAAAAGGKRKSSDASSMACPVSAGAIPCSRRSGWCPRPSPASMSPRLIRSTRDDDALLRPGRAAVGKSRRRARHRARRRRVARAATRSRFSPRRRCPVSALGPSNYSRNRPASTARALSRSTASRSAGRKSTATTAALSISRSKARPTTTHEAKLKALEKAGHPVIRIVQNSLDHIGQEFFRFEIATAIAGAVIGINPFDQPDVEASKIKTRELTAAFEKSGDAAARDAGLFR